MTPATTSALLGGKDFISLSLAPTVAVMAGVLRVHADSVYGYARARDFFGASRRQAGAVLR
ncbi:MAG: hypothetical protein PW734_11375 [Verrucomicrobium sp.]|nr:hypothetical protein [Verrucomicrobium sp.]